MNFKTIYYSRELQADGYHVQQTPSAIDNTLEEAENISVSSCSQ